MVDLKKLREKNLKEAKKAIQESVSDDEFIINAVNNLDELAKITNVLSKRLRDWYSLYLPEVSKNISDHEAFVKRIITANRVELLKEFDIKDPMGKDLNKRDLEPIQKLASKIKELYDLRDELKTYVEGLLESYAPNLKTVAGSMLAAKLIREGGSLKKLVMMPSSKLQLLGAEAALFRHLKSGARPPKHGIILQHPLVSGSKKDIRGKSARSLADKITLAVKTDYFKGKFIGDKLRKELEEKLK